MWTMGLVVSRRGRTARVWMRLCLASLLVTAILLLTTLSFHPLRKSQADDRSEKSSPEFHQTRTPCRVDTLPASVLLHCQMYWRGIITGTLCDPLCNRGYICDVTSTHGNAHKEVMTSQCQEFCHQGQEVKVILKHDEISASPTGYIKVYESMNKASLQNQGNTFEQKKKIVQSLFMKHLPLKDSHLAWQDLLENMSSDFRTSNIQEVQSLPSVVYNSLLLLLRQKEYVLFRAYREKGVFPRVYGSCGPLYLVEYCDPVVQLPNQFLNQDSIFNHIVYPHKLSTRNPQSIKSSKTIFDFVSPRFFSKSGEVESHAKPGNFLTIRQSFTKENILESKPDNYMNGIKFNARPSLNSSWTSRAQSAVNILRFLGRLETQTFSENMHLCDPKLEHFAISREDGKLRLIDADLLLFDGMTAPDAEVPLPEVAAGACTDHEDCSDVTCRGWCRKESRQCERVRVNNNLQALCQYVFLTPSLQYGAVFDHIPPAAYDDVIDALCHCATYVTEMAGGIPFKKPSVDVRVRLIQAFEKSMSFDSHSGLERSQKDTASYFESFLINRCSLK